MYFNVPYVVTAARECIPINNIFTHFPHSCYTVLNFESHNLKLNIKYIDVSNY